MFTLEHINGIHDGLGSMETFAKYIHALRAIGVKRFDSYLFDGHSEFFGDNGYMVASPAYHDVLTVSGTGDSDALKKHLALHEDGKTTYEEMSKGLADSGVEKWTADTVAMTMKYLDTKGQAMLAEVIE